VRVTGTSVSSGTAMKFTVEILAAGALQTGETIFLLRLNRRPTFLVYQQQGSKCNYVLVTMDNKMSFFVI